MNPLMFVMFGIGFYISLRMAYELWFAPKEYRNRIDGQRRLMKKVLGFSYWKEGEIDLIVARAVSVLAALLTLLGLIISITGPIHK